MADGMIALVPAPEDARRLAVSGGLEADELHVTVGYLDDIGMASSDRLADLALDIASRYAPFTGEAFSVSMFNPNSDTACAVLGVGGYEFKEIHQFFLDHEGERYPQRAPYIPHMTLRYTDDASVLAEYTNLTGPIRFEKVRLAIGESNWYFPMSDMGMSMTAAVNTKYWRSWPQAERETKFNADQAIDRLLAWSGGSASKFNQAFLWRNSEGQPNNRESYRLPIADVINGKLTLIPRAVFSAAVILSGGHGGLEGVVDETEREKLKAVLNQIYADLQEQYQDPRVRPPWLLGRTVDEREEDEEEMTASAFDDEEFGQGVWHIQGLVASVNSSGWSGMPLASPDHPWDGGAARNRVWEWSGGDFRKYRRAFLWWDASKAEQKNSYKLPIADVIDGELKIVPRAVNAVASVLGGGRGGVDIPSEDMDSVQRIVDRIQARIHKGQDSVEASAAEVTDAPVFPHSSAFEPRMVSGPTPFTVLADGTAFGHLWLWNKCHAGIGDTCVVAPRSATNYAYFHNGQVLTSDGKLVKVGKITMGTGHAAHGLRWIPAADHYDNTGTAAAIVHITEDRWGGMASGTLVSTLTPEQAQELRRSPISGDWRRIGNNLELVAALAVNTPGFPIVASINGEVEAVLSAGILLADGSVHAEMPEDATREEKNLADIVDKLDQKVFAIKARERGRVFDRLSASVKERGK